MSDKVVLHHMEFEAHVGAGDGERAELQVIEVDVEMSLDLREAGTHDGLERTVHAPLEARRITVGRSASTICLVQRACSVDGTERSCREQSKRQS